MPTSASSSIHIIWRQSTRSGTWWLLLTMRSRLSVVNCRQPELKRNIISKWRYVSWRTRQRNTKRMCQIWSIEEEWDLAPRASEAFSLSAYPIFTSTRRARRISRRMQSSAKRKNRCKRLCLSRGRQASSSLTKRRWRNMNVTISSIKRSPMSKIWRSKWTSATCSRWLCAPPISPVWIKKVQTCVCSTNQLKISQKVAIRINNNLKQHRQARPRDSA